jgi:hypothetical protein
VVGLIAPSGAPAAEGGGRGSGRRWRLRREVARRVVDFCYGVHFVWRRCYNKINLLLKLFCCFATLLRNCCYKISGGVSDKFGFAIIAQFFATIFFTILLQMENMFATRVSSEFSGEFHVDVYDNIRFCYNIIFCYALYGEVFGGLSGELSLFLLFRR